MLQRVMFNTKEKEKIMNIIEQEMSKELYTIKGVCSAMSSKEFTLSYEGESYFGDYIIKSTAKVKLTFVAILARKIRTALATAGIVTESTGVLVNDSLTVRCYN